jgi:tRNA (guanine-N7-)-methyltransferase
LIKFASVETTTMADLTPTFSKALHRYFVPWRQLNWPLDWDELFDSAQRVGLEIGFGNGEFLAALAKQNPHLNYIGIERSWGSIQRCIRRSNNQALKNIRLLEGDAPWMLQHFFKPESLSEVYVNFSDPWPKEKHHDRRVIQPEFIQLLAGRLKMNGQIIIATDHAEYAEWILDVLTRQTLLASALDAPVVHQIEGRLPTKYERKALALGHQIHYFVWHKVRATPEASVVTSEVKAMPNAQIQGNISVNAVLDALPPQAWQEPEHDVIIRLVCGYRAQNKDGGLLEMLVKEGAMTQQLGILIKPQEEGRMLLLPSSIGYPRPTWGIKRAIWHVVNTLLVAYPELTVASTTVGEFSPNTGQI